MQSFSLKTGKPDLLASGRLLDRVLLVVECHFTVLSSLKATLLCAVSSNK